MKTAAIVPARWALNPDGLPFSPEYGDLYHPQAGAIAQARHVFLGGNHLPARWQGQDRFVVLETGFGLGNNFLATWDAWRHDPHRCRQLHFISIERHPFTRADLQRVHQDSALRELADALVNAWPPLTPNLHRLGFDNGQVQLLLALGDVASWLPELVASVDAFFLDGFAPDRNPAMWQPRLFKAMARLAAPGATAATWTAAQSVRAGLQAAGFDVQTSAGTGGKRDITLACFAPAFQPRSVVSARRAPTRASDANQHAVIVGAGLAGCAAAWALAQQGWTSTLIDRHAVPAQEASGNPGGLFHGIVNPQDGAHARFNRAAALQAQQIVRRVIAEQGVAGSVQGMLRLEPARADAVSMQQQLRRSGLPHDYVQALSAEHASTLAGMRLLHPAWFYPGGGWVDPGAFARALLALAGDAATCCGGEPVDCLRRSEMGWELQDTHGRVIALAQTLVLANAFDALRLLRQPAWPVENVRGQISMCPAAALPALPRIPIAGAGYLLPAVGSWVVFGATAQAGDGDAAVRHGDHAHNLSQLARLTGVPNSPVRAEDLQGRTAWRMVSGDRLPIIGGVPDIGAPGRRLDQPRFVPRLPGLFVFTALGSRGITWAALGAQVLASAITGAPQALEASLLDAIDPARFVSRAARRSSAGR